MNARGVVEAARARLHTGSRDGAITARGRGEVRGLPVTWMRTCDAAGRVVETISGPLGGAQGFDGRAGWRVDETGMPGVLELGDLEDMLVATAVWSGAWTNPGGRSESGPLHPGPGAIAIDDAVAVDGSRLVLALCAGTRRYRLMLDASTHLPSRLEPAGRDDVGTTFTDYRPGGWGLVPHHVVHRAGWLSDTLDVESCAADPAPAFEPVGAIPDDTTFDDAGVAWKFTRGKLPLVEPRIDGRAVGWFVLDTGAGALAIGEGAAASLRLAELGRRFVRTADGAGGAPFRRAQTLTVGPATIRTPLFLELDLATFGRAARMPLAGVLGYDVFQRAVVTIDPVAGIAIAAGAEGDGWLPLRFEDGVPAVAARVPGPGGPRDALFAIDTGSAASVTITAGAAQAFELRGGSRVALRGVTGAVGAVARTIPWIELAGHRIEDVAALVARPGPGAFGDPDPGAGIAGTLGMGLLRGFTMTLDYRGRRVRLVRRSRLREARR